MSDSLDDFLNKKSLYYDKIDFSVVHDAWKSIQSHIKLPFVIHLVGTNGKGSTGRFLSHYLFKKELTVLHYSSPHILRFNERFWINGNDVSDEDLENAHLKLQTLLDSEILDKLTYFEYTTLLAFILSSNLDYLVLEAGLGGEFDATNVVKNDLTLVTTIDLDHQDFLGNTIREIAATKMRSCDKTMIVGHQNHEQVLEVANGLKKEVFSIDDFNISLDGLNLEIPEYLINNLKLCICALTYLNIDIDLSLFDDMQLFGRYQKISQNIIIDVGHNPLAAAEVVKSFLNESKKHKKSKKINLIYNSYKDKDYKQVLKIMKPIVKSVEIIEINDKRAADKKDITAICSELDMDVSNFTDIDYSKEYLVFGSFMVVENFLKRINYEK